MRYVDIGIPANNKEKHSIGFLYWILAKMVLQICETISQGPKWVVMVDLFFYREPEEENEQEEETPIFADYADHSAGGAIGGGWDDVDGGWGVAAAHDQLPYQYQILPLFLAPLEAGTL
ncbi:40S ribosomal protein SA [Capsicum annuum]|nr:40S ribosomal protein SA [Capsicum annuum]